MEKNTQCDYTHTYFLLCSHFIASHQWRTLRNHRTVHSLCHLHSSILYSGSMLHHTHYYYYHLTFAIRQAGRECRSLQRFARRHPSRNTHLWKRENTMPTADIAHPAIHDPQKRSFHQQERLCGRIGWFYLQLWKREYQCKDKHPGQFHKKCIAHITFWSGQCKPTGLCAQQNERAQSRELTENDRINRCETGTLGVHLCKLTVIKNMVFYRKCLFSLYLQLISHPTYLSDI